MGERLTPEDVQRKIIQATAHFIDINSRFRVIYGGKPIVPLSSEGQKLINAFQEAARRSLSEKVEPAR